MDPSGVPVPPPARRLWRTLAGDPSVLRPGTVRLVHGSRGIAPPGWTGVLRLGDAFLIEVGDADAATIETLRSLEDPSDPADVVRLLEPSETLGPGELFYLPDGAEVAAVDVAGDVAEVRLEAIQVWLAELPAGDVAESSLSDMEDVLILRRGGEVLGAAGHLSWPSAVGHLGVLVAPGARGAAVGSCLGALATQRVLERGEFPQWRAAAWNDASQIVARRIGYRLMGRQFSFRLG